MCRTTGEDDVETVTSDSALRVNWKNASVAVDPLTRQKAPASGVCSSVDRSTEPSAVVMSIGVPGTHASPAAGSVGGPTVTSSSHRASEVKSSSRITK